MIPNAIQPRLSPWPLLDLTENIKTIGITITPTMLAPMLEPTRAYVAVFSRSAESNEIAGIIDQKPTSLNE